MSSPVIVPSTIKEVLTPPGSSYKGEEMYATSRHCALGPGGGRCLSWCLLSLSPFGTVMFGSLCSELMLTVLSLPAIKGCRSSFVLSPFHSGGDSSLEGTRKPPCWLKRNRGSNLILWKFCTSQAPPSRTHRPKQAQPA